MRRKRETYAKNQSPLYKLKSRKKLAALLHAELRELKCVHEYAQYNVYAKEKEKGGSRVIEAPASRIKQLQRRINTLLMRIEKPDWLISSTLGKSYKDNAAMHKSNGYLMVMDIKSFYPNCTRDYVYRFFRGTMACSPDVSACLSDICTFNEHTPTGSPASQLLAFFAYEKMFLEIEALARKYGCIMTLYVDDMAFSSNMPFGHRKMSHEITAILHKYGHDAKASKTKTYSPRQYKLITGVAITPDHTLAASNKLRHKVINDIHRIKETESLECVSAIKGRMGAMDYIEDRHTFPGIRGELSLIERKTSQR